MELTLRRRRGFVRIALMTGASIVPVIGYGENELFNQPFNRRGSPFRKFQDRVQKALGFAPVMFYGRGVFNYSCGVLPHRRPINVVIGSPLATAKDRCAEGEAGLELQASIVESIEKASPSAK